MRMHLWRITGAVAVSAALLGSASVGLAAQPSAAAPTMPVIVFLKSQPAGGNRTEEAASDQAPLILVAAQLGAKNIRRYQLVNSFAATVSPQALTELAASPDVAEVIPDVTIHADLGQAPATPASAGSAGAVANVIPGACTSSANGQLVPEGLSLTGTASDDSSQPTARSLGFTGAGVKVAVI